MLAVANYEDHHEHYPRPYLPDAEGRPMHSWRVSILPYLEQQAVHERYDFARRWDEPNNRDLAPLMPRTYAFHGDHKPGLTTTNYLAVVGPETIWPGNQDFYSRDVCDGLSNTILVVENRGAAVHWMEPRDLSFATMSFKLNDPAGVSSKYADPAVAMLDGSVQRLRKGITPAALRALLTADGGEDLGQHDGQWVVLPDGRQRDLAGP